MMATEEEKKKVAAVLRAQAEKFKEEIYRKEKCIEEKDMLITEVLDNIVDSSLSTSQDDPQFGVGFVFAA